MKKKNKIILFLLSVFSLVPMSVHAIAMTTVALVISGFGIVMTVAGFSAIGISDGTAVNTEYDPRIALFDNVINTIPRCDDDYFISSDGTISIVQIGDNVKFCSKNAEPDINKLVDYLPYIVRMNVKLKNTDISYPVFYFFKDAPKVDETNSNYYRFTDFPYFIINYIPDDNSVFSTNISSKKYAYERYGNHYYYFNSNMIGYSDSKFLLNKSYLLSVGYLNDLLYKSSNDYFEFNYATNFDLYTIDADLINSKTIQHEFDTDTDVAIPKDYYLFLVPKKREEYSSYFYTDNNFAYTFDYYDKLANSYSSVDRGALTQINFGSMGGFNWFKWTVNFSDTDITYNKTIRIFNPTDQTLNIKFNASDFYYSLSTKGSPDFCIDDLNICFKNNYDDLNSFGHSFDYKNIYDNGDYESGISFIKSISNLVKEFSKAFVFIGTIFTSFFTIFNGTISNYFYIVFGLAIIILILKVLK